MTDTQAAVLSAADALRFADVMDCDYIGLHSGSTLHQFVENLLQGSRRQLHIRVQVSNFESVCRMVEAGVGVGIVPESAAARNIRTMNFIIKQLDESWAIRERHVLARLGEALPTYTQALIDSIVAHHRQSAPRKARQTGK